MQENYNEEKQTTEVETNQSHVFSGLDKSRKIALAVLAFFALFVFVYGAFSIQKGIYTPFRPATTAKQTEQNSGTSAYCPNENCADITDADLKNKDTDKDGLSDYDESNVYKTSPYLEDSDSDGFSDKEEIDNNKDPICPTGRECAGNVLVNGEADLTNPGEANNIDLEALEALEKNRIETAASTEGTASETIDAAALREMLIEAGMEKAQLDLISDKDLMAEFESALAEESAQ